jgi:CIC family chloride channel protein
MMKSPAKSAGEPPTRSQQRSSDDASPGHGSLTELAILSLVAGVAAGIVGALFRLALDKANVLRNTLIAWAHEEKLFGLLFVVVGAGAAVAIAAWLVRRFAPHASGSGIPHVEAVLNQELPPASLSLIPVKFVGGLLAIGSGLALGREGPTVQMGASVAHLVGSIFRRKAPDGRVLLAAGAGAGLATAFNAPIAGAVFVLEELVRRFDTRITIATFGASAGAITVARMILGEKPDFEVPPLPFHDISALPLYLLLGLLAGLLGVAYNRAMLGTLAAVERLHRMPVELRAGLIGAIMGLLAWFLPTVVGGGDSLTQSTLMGTGSLLTVSLVFLLRFGLGPLSYGALTPGGLFAPLLVLGAQCGLLLGAVGHHWLPAAVPTPTAVAVVGMAAFFTAVVRAPVTGIILVTEMTASFTLLLPMLGACFTAMIVPTLLGDQPIYESLHERLTKHDVR